MATAVKQENSLPVVQLSHSKMSGFLVLLFFGISFDSCHARGGNTLNTVFKTTDYSKGDADFYNRFISFAYQRNNSYFHITSDNRFNISNSSEPLRFDDVEYFFVKPAPSMSDYCEYKLGDMDTFFLKTTLENGTHPSGVYFACTWQRTCQGLECKWGWWTSCFWFLIIPACLLIAALHYCAKGCKKNRRADA